MLSSAAAGWAHMPEASICPMFAVICRTNPWISSSSTPQLPLIAATDVGSSSSATGSPSFCAAAAYFDCRCGAGATMLDLPAGP